MIVSRDRFLAAVAIGLLLWGAGRAAAEVIRISEDTLWEGKIARAGNTMILKGATLTVEAGTEIEIGAGHSLVIEGRLIVKGTEDRPVIIRSSDWGSAGEKRERFQRIFLISSREANVFEHCLIEGAGEGVSAVGSTVAIRHIKLRDCGVGIQLDSNSAATAEGVEISGTEIGFMVQRGSTLDCRGLWVKGGKSGLTATTSSHLNLKDSGLEDLGAAMLLSEIQDVAVKNILVAKCQLGIVGIGLGDNVLVEDGTIKECQTGIAMKSFSRPRLQNNQISGCERGMEISTFSFPKIIGNRFESNQVAISSGQKSVPVIENNMMAGNEVGILIDLSSYPLIHFNTIMDNPVAIRLGDMESADWELRAGSSRLTREQAAKAGSLKIPSSSLQEPEDISSRRLPQNNFLDGWVDARWNWWGEKVTAEMRSKGFRADISVIDDSFDRPEVTYEGYPGSYRLDRVEYAPFLDEPWGQNPF